MRERIEYILDRPSKKFGRRIILDKLHNSSTYWREIDDVLRWSWK